MKHRNKARRLRRICRPAETWYRARCLSLPLRSHEWLGAQPSSAAARHRHDGRPSTPTAFPPPDHVRSAARSCPSTTSPVWSSSPRRSPDAASSSSRPAARAPRSPLPAFPSATSPDVTGFPEMMDGRVKTLHPKVHGGLLGVRDDPGHAAAMEAHGIAAIDLLVVNLYPFEATVAGGADYATAVENIDIGGPAMIRAGGQEPRLCRRRRRPRRLCRACSPRSTRTTAPRPTRFAQAPRGQGLRPHRRL